MTQSSAWKLPVFLLAAAGVLVAYGVTAALYFAEADRLVLAAAFTVAVIGTEVLFWLGAGLLSWKVFESRKRIWARLTGRGAAVEGGR